MIPSHNQDTREDSSEVVLFEILLSKDGGLIWRMNPKMSEISRYGLLGILKVAEVDLQDDLLDGLRYLPDDEGDAE